MLQQSWSIDRGSYVLTIATPGEKGDFSTVAKIINRFSSIMSIISLDVNKESEFSKVRRLVITLEPGVTKKNIEDLRTRLDKKGYSVLQIEDLHTN